MSFLGEDPELVSTCAIVNALIERPASGLVAYDRELRVAFSSPDLVEVLAEHGTAVAGLVARVRETGEPIFEVNVGVGPHAALVASAYPIKTGDEVVGVGCVVENGARDREASALLDGTALAIAVFDGPQHRVRLLNRPWQERVGITGSVGMQLRELVTSAFGDALFASLDRVFETHEPVHFDEVVLRAPDRLYSGVIAPVRTALGVVRGVMMICAERADDTQRGLAVHHAQRNDARARDQFLASVAHELRAPITTVLLWEKILRDAPDDLELRERALDAIHQSTVAQARLVDDLLDISRAISGKLRVDLRPLDLGPVLASAIDAEEPAALAKHQRIDRTLPDELGSVSADLARLCQILRNLLANAIKFTPDGGTIRVSARRDGRYVRIDIADSGRGIAREFLPRLFEPFSQAEDSLALARAHDGLGLGLAISYQLVVAHGGQLSASSAGPGLGSTFTLSLPILAQPAAAAPLRGPASRLAELRLLVVDDDRRVLDALQVLLELAGATVEVADSVELGFASLLRAPPDVVLSDLAMPGEDGYSFIRRIRALAGAAGRVAAVAITAHITEADRDRALAAGFDLYVTKPVNMELLISTIVRLVETRRAG